MDREKKPTTAVAVSAERPSRRPCRSSNVRMVQNFLVIWLDASIDETNDEDCRNFITELRQVVNTVNTFTNPDECIDYVTDIMAEKTFMIVSETFGEIIIPVVQHIPQVVSLYITYTAFI